MFYFLQVCEYTIMYTGLKIQLSKPTRWLSYRKDRTEKDSSLRNLDSICFKWLNKYTAYIYFI